ncbi:hypothetical protein [Mesorhizobium sp. M0296]|uniref:hypothetical protein n=1 Tax=Mesorhizobium sp. M0296 TaxID=2956931 RepID=UPI0033367FC0
MRVWYDDQRAVHAQIERGDELVDYAFMGNNAQAADNRWLREAYELQIPILYFLGVAPQRYTLIWPTYVAEWSAADLKVQLAFGAPVLAAKDWAVPEAPERRYGLRLVRQRLHQAAFREAVLAAYGNRCPLWDYLNRAYWTQHVSWLTSTRSWASQSSGMASRSPRPRSL